MRSAPAHLAARLALLSVAIVSTPSAALSQEITAIDAPSQSVADRIKSILSSNGTANFSIADLDAEALRGFYGGRLYQPAWTQGPAAQANANLAVMALQHADEDGLLPDRYHLGELNLRRNAQTAQAAAEYDLILTDGVLRYARELRQGQSVLRDLDDDVGLTPDLFDPAAALQSALGANRLGDFLASLPPPHPEYRNLKTALALERAKGTSGGHTMEIIANMERWRWVPRAFGPRYVAVNAANATLEAIDGGTVVLTSPVIVGKRASRTPLFSTVATGLTINPSWHVPGPIIRHEILPKLRANPSYLARKHMVRGENGGIRQLPGAGNALGYIKFEMPNDFDVYLHDTPMRSLFAKDDRHLSHGCIRVGQIQPLASFALTGDRDSGLGRIRSLIMTRSTRTISLDRPLPIFVLYRTVVADADGAVNYYPDVYGRDQRLIAALAAQRLSSRITMNFGEASRN